MKIEHFPISKLKPNPDNPRRLKKTELQSLKKSLQDCPEMLEARPLLLSNRTGDLVVVGGNMRLRAGKELGYKTMPWILKHRPEFLTCLHRGRQRGAA